MKQHATSMARMVRGRLTYIVQDRGLSSSCQCGFQRGSMTMDPVLCLEETITKVQANKEQVSAIFFDIEMAYDVLWSKGTSEWSKDDFKSVLGTWHG